jgi:hypothetical protein
MADGCRNLAATVSPAARLQMLSIAQQFERLAEQHKAWDKLGGSSSGADKADCAGNPDN